ncbi:MAG TPA: permease [Thermodesulfobacteriota bacterium]|nr:permease [Thermodesulfobacteriota bacterium]
MGAEGGFNVWWGLLGLLPLVVYIILVFRDVDPLPATAICVLIGAILTHQSLVSFGEALADALSSLLALVGLIIMLGRGLGEVLIETKVSHTLVHKIIFGIGIDTEKKAMLGIMLACMVVIGLLGTMAGGNAILAPIILPIAASVGLSRSAVAVIFQAVGEEALILGPFTPPVVTLLGLTKIGYGGMLLFAAGPIALITFTATWFMLQRIQRRTRETNPYERLTGVEQFVPTPRSKRATGIFVVLFLAAVVYGIIANATTPYVIVVILGLAIITGGVGGLNFNQILKLVIKGMAGNVGLFFLFLLLDPFINFIKLAGGFKALAILLKPLIDLGGKTAIVILGGLIGAFGISGATVATLNMLHSMFNPMLSKLGVSMLAWSVALIVATRVSNFIYPGANMFSSLGFAETKDLKSMLKNGWVVAGCQIFFLIIYSLLLA